MAKLTDDEQFRMGFERAVEHWGPRDNCTAMPVYRLKDAMFLVPIGEWGVGYNAALKLLIAAKE